MALVCKSECNGNITVTGRVFMNMVVWAVHGEVEVEVTRDRS